LPHPTLCVEVNADHEYQTQSRSPLRSRQRTTTPSGSTAPVRGTTEASAPHRRCLMESRATVDNIPKQPRPQQLLPWAIPRWPSMLKYQSQVTAQSTVLEHVRSSQLTLPPTLPRSILVVPKRSTLTPRGMMMDSDRRRICRYAEEHPKSKQRQIGGVPFRNIHLAPLTIHLQ